VRRDPATRTRLTSRRALVGIGSSPDVHELAGTAAVVWRALAEGVTVSELIVDLAAVFGVEENVVAVDVRRLLDDLVASGLAEVAPT
jgi:Coenzyme PQQ synthesis protein D (PqqD)